MLPDRKDDLLLLGQGEKKIIDNDGGGVGMMLSVGESVGVNARDGRGDASSPPPSLLSGIPDTTTTQWRIPDGGGKDLDGDARIKRLLDWCALRGIYIDRRVSVREVSDEERTGMRVYALEDIEAGTPIVKIPKHCVLSTRSTAFADQFRSGDGMGEEASVHLALALLCEASLGERSFWYDYLATLPAHVPIALFWSMDPAREVDRRWLVGTEAERWLAHEGQVILDRIEAFYVARVRPLLGVERAAWYRAYSLVSSRAFVVDEWHGLGLVPVADAFDHVEEYNVELETDWEEAGMCEMVMVSRVEKGVEVLNTYDARGIPNVRLLCEYGFVLDGNGVDVVEIGAGLVVDADGNKSEKLEEMGARGDALIEERVERMKTEGQEAAATTDVVVRYAMGERGMLLGSIGGRG